MFSKENLEIIVKPFEFTYFSDIWEYSQNDKIYQFLEYDKFKAKKDFKEWIMKKLNNGVFFVIVKKNLDKCIGTISISDIDEKRMSCSVGYALDQKYQGQGFFSKALDLLIGGLEEIGFARVWAVTSSNNKKSIKALLRNSFEKEGHLRSFYKGVNNEYEDALIVSRILINNNK